MRVARVSAQAKVNLWLRVGPRDPTGYHEIHTLFHRIDLADDVTVRVGGSVRAIDVAGPRVPATGLGAPERNLAYRAAVAYAEQAGWVRGFAIELTKHIPVGGGLGGGSADAGAVLRALDALAPTPIGESRRLAIAATLGADVAFLASDAVAAVGTGRGERLEAMDPLPSRDVVIVVPGFSIATADAYQWLDASRTSAPRLESPALPRVDWNAVGRASHNDFEPVVEARHDELTRIRERLRDAGARIARLAGSGSSVFAVFDGGAPPALRPGVNGAVIATRSSSRVVPVVVAE